MKSNFLAPLTDQQSPPSNDVLKIGFSFLFGILEGRKIVCFGRFSVFAFLLRLFNDGRRFDDVLFSAFFLWFITFQHAMIINC